MIWKEIFVLLEARVSIYTFELAKGGRLFELGRLFKQGLLAHSIHVLRNFINFIVFYHYPVSIFSILEYLLVILYIFLFYTNETIGLPHRHALQLEQQPVDPPRPAESRLHLESSSEKRGQNLIDFVARSGRICKESGDEKSLNLVTNKGWGWKFVQFWGG